ncbi:MAG: Abi family protein, partial [Campylobacter sp.]|nr:Abi family protein [Campylobacter sp.]
MAKSKLNIDGQIEHLKEKGISFLLVDENEARNILSNHTYYFKIKSYAKNYSKDKNGKYIDLEFAYLVELSKLDMYLRRILLDITLDLEHALKTSLLNDFNKTQEDGYRIVNSFLNSSRGKNAQKYINGLKNRTDNTTSSILVKKYQTNLPIWVLIEVIQLHDLMKFYEFFYGKYNTFYAKSELSFITNAIFSTKCLRNLAAHNNCIIKNIFEKNAQTIQKQCKQELACNTKTIEKYGEKLDEIL